MKQQIVYIPGGDAKENFVDYYDFLGKLSYDPYEIPFQSWNKTLGEYLGDDIEYLRVPFRERQYADYEAWKIMFEKMFPYLRDDVILVAGSMGGAFILKYMIENGFPFQIKKMFFVAAVLNKTPQEKLGTFAFDKTKITSLERYFPEMVIYHSSDDAIVPISDGVELHGYFPKATFRTFTDRGHFHKQARFPEIEEDIRR